MHLRQTGSVADYQENFLALPTRAPLNTEQQVQIFMADLTDTLQIDVELAAPHNLEIATSLARAYERRTLAVVDTNRTSTVGRTSGRPHPRNRSGQSSSAIGIL